MMKPAERSLIKVVNNRYVIKKVDCFVPPRKYDGAGAMTKERNLLQQLLQYKSATQRLFNSSTKDGSINVVKNR